MSDSQTPRRTRRYALGLSLGGLILVVVALAVWFRPSPPAPPKAVVTDEELKQALAVENPGYVGIEVCAECHANRARLVKSTRHYLACRSASEGVAAPGFAPGRGKLNTRVPGLHYEMARSGCEFVITQVKKTAQGETRLP